MAEIKVLTPEEWHLLDQVPDGVVLDPKFSTAIVALDGDKVVGRMYVVVVPHLEGSWLDPEWKNGLTALRMERKADEAVKQAGATKLFAFAEEQHEPHMKLMGFTKEKYSVWSKEV